MMSSIVDVVRRARRRSVPDLVKIAATWAFQDNVYAYMSRRIINEHDARLPTEPTLEEPAVHHLFKHGYVNMGPLVDVDGLAAKFRSVVDSHPQSAADLNKIIVAHPALFHPTVTDVLKVQKLNRVVRAYLGDDATLDELQLFRTPDCSTKVELPSGLWHHDGNGHVLLLWVLLTDVDSSCRATWYVPGSHHRPLTDNAFSHSRFTDQQVQEYGKPIQLLGKKGDALLMDPHGLHRAAYEKGKHRDVMYYGFSSYAKGCALAFPGLNHGCGIIDDRFPHDFDPSGTLVRRERLFRQGEFLEYRGHGGREPLRASKWVALIEPNG
jgi:hypothetical protein